MALFVSFASPKLKIENTGLFNRKAPPQLTRLINRLRKFPYQPVNFLAEILERAGYDDVYVDAGARDLLDQVAKSDLASDDFDGRFDQLCAREKWKVKRFAYRWINQRTKKERIAFVVVADQKNITAVENILKITRPGDLVGGRLPAKPSSTGVISNGGKVGGRFPFS